MKHVNTSKNRSHFKVIAQAASSQAAMMTLQPGDSSSDKVENEHPKAEQWVFIISGSGKATVGQKTIRLNAGSLLLIEKREPHKITNHGKSPLVTLNFYAPPAYTMEGEVKPSAKRS